MGKKKQVNAAMVQRLPAIKSLIDEYLLESEENLESAVDAAEAQIGRASCRERVFGKV